MRSNTVGVNINILAYYKCRSTYLAIACKCNIQNAVLYTVVHVYVLVIFEFGALCTKQYLATCHETQHVVYLVTGQTVNLMKRTVRTVQLTDQLNLSTVPTLTVKVKTNQ